MPSGEGALDTGAVLCPPHFTLKAMPLAVANLTVALASSAVAGWATAAWT